MAAATLARTPQPRASQPVGVLAPPTPGQAGGPANQQARSGGAVMNLAKPALRLSSRPGGDGAGRPLAASVSSAMQRTTGASLGDVRVFQGGATSAALDAAGARAVTYGSSIYLATRESPTDLALMAHEATHVIQQRGSPRLQAKMAAASVGTLEAEADRVATAAQSGASARVSGSTAPRAQFAWGIDAVATSVRNAAGGLVSAVADGLDVVRTKAVAYVREHARAITGYDLLGFVIGRDPLTQTPIDRNASTLLKAVLGLVPGGAQIYDDLEKSKVLERAFAWVSGELDRLGLTWARVRSAVEGFVASLGAGDLVNLPGVLARATTMFSAIIEGAIAFARSCGQKLMELAFEGAMALAGSAGQRVMGVFRKVGDTFGLIAADPGGFFANLGAALLGGFEQFRDKFGFHLQNALVGWLFGALQDAGLKLPDKFDAKGILSIVLQVLGLTYDNLRKRLVDLVGESVVSTIETTLDFVVVLVRDGVAAAWEKIVEFAGNLKDMVIGAIKDFIGKTIFAEALKLIGKLLVPGGALITLCIKIYETVMFVIEKAKALLDFVEAVVDSIANIARGNLGAAKDYVEKTLAKLLPLAIGFLAQLVGLGGLSGHIKNAIMNIQAPINTALNKLVEWIKEKAKSIVGKVKDWWKERRGFTTKDGQEHELFYSGDEKNAVAMVASGNPQPCIKQIEIFWEQASAPSASPEEKKAKNKLQKTKEMAIKKPNAPSLLEDMKEYFYVFKTASREMKVEGKTSSLGGDMVGTEMTVDWLGPNHPEGTEPESGVQDNLMGLLVTAPRKGLTGPNKYIRGHLLNHNLGGRGDAKNMFPITGNANNQHLHSIENKIRVDWVDKQSKTKTEKWVWYQVKVDVTEIHLDRSLQSSPLNYVNCVFICEAKQKDATGKVLDTWSSRVISTYGTKETAIKGELPPEK